MKIFSIGTRSMLFGAHCFFLHPWFVAFSWYKLYGFPFDPRLWVAFFFHDFGYFGKTNMDGPEGETHPEFGANIMTFLFGEEWGDFTRYHSRYYAKKNGKPVSKLCFADKLSFVYTPRWLYLLMVTLTGEIYEYLENGKSADNDHWKPTGDDAKVWHSQLKSYFIKWVNEHRDGVEDTWTAKRHLGKE